MTAHRRTRKTKTKTKRSNLDDNSYSERYRQASNGAKAASRKGSGDRSPGVEAGRGLAIEIGEGARITGISLVPEGQGTGYILTVGEERIHEEDGTPVVRKVDEDHVSVGPLTFGEDWYAELHGQEDLRQEAASDAASLGQRGVEGASGEVPAEGSEPTHRAFFEAEVNSLPTHVGTELCSCDKREDHWIELGEI